MDSSLQNVKFVRLDAIGVHRPVDLSPKWLAGVVTKVRSVRVAAMPGMEAFVDEEYELQNATGVIELTGHREGALRTKLLIGFADNVGLPPPAFALTKTQAIGTLSFPSHEFVRFFQIANLPNAHFRIGGNGSMNGVASEPSIFMQIGQTKALGVEK